MTTDNPEKTARVPESPPVHSLDCAAIRELLFAYMMHELGDAQSLLVREHLRHCKDCTTEVAEIQKTIDFMKGHDPAQDAPVEISPKRRRRMIWFMMHPFLALCAKHYRITAATVVLVVFVLVWLIAAAIEVRRPSRKQITAPIRFEVAPQPTQPEPLDYLPPPADDLPVPPELRDL